MVEVESVTLIGSDGDVSWRVDDLGLSGLRQRQHRDSGSAGGQGIGVKVLMQGITMAGRIQGRLTASHIFLTFLPARNLFT
jgi:hypothetical protein